MRLYFFVLFLSVFFSFGCNSQTSKELQLPAIPSTLTIPQQRADFLVIHFWDNMDFSDNSLVSDKEFMEQNFSNFVSVFPVATPDTLIKAVDNIFRACEKNPEALKSIMEISEKYLFEQESPLLNEEYYRLFLTDILDSPVLNDMDKIRPAYQMELISKNRVGTEAANFDFTLLNGERMSLAGLNTGNDILLIFFDPDCMHCKQVLEEIIQHPADIARQIGTDNFTTVAIYSGDEIDIWKNYATTLPSDWIVGYESGNIYEENIYDLPSMPTIYLLNKDRIILAKRLNLI